MLDIVRCPKCSGKIKIDEGDGLFGIASCGCSVYPVVFSILVLKRDDIARRLLDLVRKKKYGQIPAIILGREYFKFRVLSLLESMGGRWTFAAFRSARALDLWNTGRYSSVYFKYRYGSGSFVATFPFLSYCRGRTLELCSGTGHFSYWIDRMLKTEASAGQPAVPQKPGLVCLDHSVKYLFLLKKFFAKDAFCISMDLNERLPFSDGVFSTVVCVDGLHYLSDKKKIIDESKRTLTDNGNMVFTHTHNRLNRRHAFTGDPLSPAEYRGLFGDYRVNLYPEEKFFNCPVNLKDGLGYHATPEELDASYALQIVAGKSPVDFSEIPAMERRITDALVSPGEKKIINPIFGVKKTADGFLLKLKIPHPEFLREYPEIKTIFPEEIKLPSDVLINTDEGLYRRFIVLNVPGRYV
ncbi:MAG: class I SAM-dependent methyltransferase [Proteobacteria bacterium]|nr:class I SAM-dependent methyltransferase [Pseudomonadota bacterium]